MCNNSFCVFELLAKSEMIVLILFRLIKMKEKYKLYGFITVTQTELAEMEVQEREEKQSKMKPQYINEKNSKLE